MGLRIDVGDGDMNQSDFVPLEINPGDTIVVQNLAGSTLNYLTNFDAGPAGTIAPSGSQTFTIAPVWLQSQGVSSVLITGGAYGN